MNKKLWAETRGSQKNCFTTTEEIRGGGGVKVCVCRHFLRITSGASRVCRHSYQRVCQHMSALPDPQHVCPMKGERFSCLYFPQKKEKYKISHDVTMNPSWTHLCQKALLQPSLSLPHFLFHLSLLHTPASQILHWAPFLFHISVFFNISPLWSMSLFFSLPPPFSSHTKEHKLFLFWQASSNWITKMHNCLPKMPGCSDYHKLCLSCGFSGRKKKMLRVHEEKPRIK